MPHSVIFLLYYSLTSRLSRRGLRTLSPGTISRGTRKTPICTATLPEYSKIPPITLFEANIRKSFCIPSRNIFKRALRASKESSNLLRSNSVNLSALDKGIRELSPFFFYYYRYRLNLSFSESVVLQSSHVFLIFEW
jgi:hypothetical protein